jgi:hypothetical protein
MEVQKKGHFFANCMNGEEANMAQIDLWPQIVWSLNFYWRIIGIFKNIKIKIKIIIIF